MDKWEISMDVNLLKKEKKDALVHERPQDWKDVIYDVVFGIVDISLDDKKNAKITPIELDGSVSNSKLAGLETVAEAGAEEIDEDFAFVDDDMWQRLVPPWTLIFNSPKREEMYFRTNLLPVRILMTRLYSALLLVLLLINYPIINVNSFASTIWTISIVLSCLAVIISWVEKGKYYVEICLESKWSRFALFAFEVIFNIK